MHKIPYVSWKVYALEWLNMETGWAPCWYEAKAEVRLIEREALAGTRVAGDAETRLQAG